MPAAIKQIQSYAHFTPYFSHARTSTMYITGIDLTGHNRPLPSVPAF